MNTKLGQFTWNYFTELRKELVSSQSIRAQIFGFKITFVSTLLGLMLVNIGKIPALVLVIPAFSANFFDSLIHSYSFSIKRIGYYCRTQLEPILRSENEFPNERPLWEQFMYSHQAGRNSAFWGTIGVTMLATVPAVWGALTPFQPLISLPLIVLLLAFLIYNYRQLVKVNTFYSKGVENTTSAAPALFVSVMIAQGQKILLVRRAPGLWDAARGSLAVNENAEEAAIRIAKEATGLDVVIKKYLGSIPNEHGVLNVCYLAEVKKGSPKARGDATELKWFPQNEIPECPESRDQTPVIALFRQNANS